MTRPRTAFTLIELLVVLGIIAMLMAILLPTLARARIAGRATVCLSNLRQMATAAQAYANLHDGRLPIGSYSESGTLAAWDLMTIDGRVAPGILWMGDAAAEVNACPEFTGQDNWGGTVDDPYSGYNYNASYLAGVPGGAAPARLVWAQDPSATAAFGDGEYSSGANKFMRAPRHIGIDGTPARDSNFIGRHAGTQGFRHGGRTQIAYLDGHAGALDERFDSFDWHSSGDGNPLLVAEGTGFLGEDNRLYDLSAE